MYYSYYYCKRANDRLISFLKEHSIAHDVHNYPSISLSLVSFTLRDNSPYLDLISGYVDTDPIVSVHYSSKEISAAEYLWLWPCKQKIDIANESEAYFNHRCSDGKIHFQTPAPAMHIKKEPPTEGRCAFWTHDTGFALLFADMRIKTLSEEANLKGISFGNILSKKGESVSNLFLLDSPCKLPLEAVAPGHGETPYKCACCGRVALEFANSYTLHLKAASIPDGTDFCMTDSFWGEGFSFPFYIISQRFYRLLKENKLTGGIRLSPVIFE